MARNLALLPLFFFIALVEALSIIQIYAPSAGAQPNLAFPILNTMLLSIISSSIIYVSGRSYLASGSSVFLMLSTGTLVLGLLGSASSWVLIIFPNGANASVTLHNIGALGASSLFVLSAILSSRDVRLAASRSRKLTFSLCCFGALIFTAFVIMATTAGFTPTFFSEGIGPTPLRQAILGTAVFLFAVASSLFMRLYFRCKIDVLHWYSLGLALFAVGFFGAVLQTSLSCSLAWAARVAQYFGGIYLLIAVLTAFKSNQAKPFESEKLINFSRLLGVLAVIASAGVLVTLWILDPQVVFEPPYLVPTLNTILVPTTSFVVAYIAGKTFLASGLRTIHLLGCGSLAYSLSSLIGAWLSFVPNGLNVFLTTQNTGALLASLLHLAGGILSNIFIAVLGPGALLASLLHLAGVILTFKKVPSSSSAHKKLRLAIGYVGGALLIIVLTAVALQGLIPPFFTVGVGSTLLRLWVLGMAIILFAFSSLLLIKLYLRIKSALLYWYSLALALIAIALTSYYLQHAVGDSFGWLGRVAQYLGGMYFVIAVLTTFKSSRTSENRIGKMRGVLNG